MDFHSEDITANFWHCNDCDFEWREEHPVFCPDCESADIVPSFSLSEEQMYELMDAVNLMNFVGNDEDDLIELTDRMNDCEWFSEDDAMCVQACWMYLNTLPRTNKIERAMFLFRFIFTCTVHYVEGN
jgi:hypothetical protein